MHPSEWASILFNLYSSMKIHGDVRERPDIHIKPLILHLKTTSKLYFMTRENIEKILMYNLSYVPDKKEFVLNLESLYDMII